MKRDMLDKLRSAGVMSEADVMRASIAPSPTAPGIKLPRGKRMRRNFTAATADRLTAGWSTTPVTIDGVIRSNLRPLRARSRDLARNNEYARRFVGLAISNVIGNTGVVMQSRIVDPDGKPDTLANNAVEAAWRVWNDKEHCDIEGRMSFKDTQRMILRTAINDGEFLVRIVKGSDIKPFGIALQQLDPELLDVELNDILKNGNKIKFGIEFNKWNRPIAYYFLADKGDYYSTLGRNYTRIPADQIIHGFLSEAVGQKRGIPWMASVMLRMKMLDGFAEASLVNARAGASKMGFITTPDGEGYQGDDEEEDGSLIAEFESGMIEQLAEGQKFTAFDPEYPKGEFKDFTKQMLHGIASGLLTSYHSLSSDLSGVNYNSGRLGALEDREIWKTMQDWLIDTLFKRIFRDWLEVQLILGSIKVAGKPLPLHKMDKFNAPYWQPKRWGWVDPVKEVQAQEKAVGLGVRSRSSIIRDMGEDPEEVWQEMAAEEARMKELGLSTVVATSAPVTKPDDEGNTDDKEDKDDE